jgi:hypothetical protein
VTKVEAVQIIMASPEDDLGDTLMQLAATYWLEQPDVSKDEVLYLFEETLGASHGD